MTERMNARALLGRYWPAVMVIAVAASLAAWPRVVEPLAQAYARFCARHLAGGPLFHHIPPYVSATLLLGITIMALTATVLSARQLVGQRRLQREADVRRRSIPAEWAELGIRAGLHGKLVVTNDHHAYAFCAGLLWPRVYISTGLFTLLTPPEVEAVLRHEAHHLRRNDPLRLFIADLLGIFLRPFPLLGAQLVRVRIAIELAADQAALAAIPLDVLASALLKAARADQSIRRPSGVVGLTPTAARIDVLLGRPVTLPLNWPDLLVTGIVVLTVIGVLAHLALVPLPMAPVCPACAPF